MEMLRPSPYCDAVSRRDETKTIKPIINQAFVSSSEDIITDYNDFYCIFTHRVASHSINITTSAVIWRNNKQQALLYTAQISRLNHQWQLFLNMKTYLQAVSQKRQTVLANLPHFTETVFVHSGYCRLLFQVQEIVLCKMRCTHSNICVVLFWNSVVNIT